MGIIREMPPSLARLIAAGEVVQRPASALKELVENALDAGATNLAVLIERGGLGRLRVADDGCGIAAEDLPLAFVRHATSKLYEEAQLEEILTFGFRGEALASIMEVARVRIQTRRAGDEVGHEITGAFGRVGEIRPSSRQPGTTIEVEQLFARVPARLEFLGSVASETNRCLRVVQHAAIGNPQVRFEFVADGRPLLHAPAVDTLAERIAQVHGDAFASTLLRVQGEMGGAALDGFVSRPDCCPRRATRSVIFINGRPVDVPAVRGAVRQVFRDRLVAGQHPEVILAVSMSPHEVDPNVAPDKSVVRLREEGGIAALAYRAVEKASAPSVPAARPAETTTVGGDQGEAQAPVHWSAPRPVASPHLPGPAPAVQEDLLPDEAAASAPRPQPVAQLDNSLLLVPLENGVLYVDQHSLHERILYDELARKSGETASQALLLPETIRFEDAAELLAFEALLEPLAAAGFMIEPAGPREYWVQATPAWSAHGAPAAALKEAVRALRAETRLRADADEVRERLLRRLACRGAVKAGTPLTMAEMQRLWQEGQKLDLALLDVHGRPGAVFVPFDRIYRDLGR